MSTIVMNKKDEIIMRLVHYFITEENYNPIIVNGVKDEIWLENAKGPYRIVRINSNNIFNKEQLDFDYFKINSIVKQIKKKTLSFNVNTLSILLDVNDELKLEGTKDITAVSLIDDSLNISSEGILEAFPDINEKLIKDANGIDLIVNVTKDINEKTERENRMYEKTFKPKKIFITPIIILTCIIMYVLIGLLGGDFFRVTNGTVIQLGANYKALVQDGEIWRLITYMFLHGSIMHLVVNMYSLFVIGTQVETFLGKWKYLIIYLVSGICGGLLSLVINGGDVVSVGASGAIFGLTGALLYFGYHYRTYLGDALKRSIIPVIILNLVIGFMMQGIDNFCHIGGLAGGLLVTMAVGIDGKSSKAERINGFICLLLYVVILSFFIFFR